MTKERNDWHAPSEALARRGHLGRSSHYLTLCIESVEPGMCAGLRRTELIFRRMVRGTVTKTAISIYMLCLLCIVDNLSVEVLMRQHIAESRIAEAHHDEMLTTGEAAQLLNSSRQHVVDLCNRGDLPFVTVGTHRRVRRSDVLAVAERTLRLTRDQRRSLWLAFAIAGRIVADPAGTRRIAESNLRRIRGKARGRAVLWLDEWQRLLDGPVPKLLNAMTSPSPHGRELRQNTPFAGVLSDAERMTVLDAWRSSEKSSRT